LPRGYAQLTDLEFADAVVVGNGPDGPVTEAFERKRLADALGCLQSGRFAGHQLIGLRECYEFVWLVIEDEIRADPRTGILQRRYEQRVKGRRKGSGRVEGRWIDAMFGAKSTIMHRDFMHWLLSMRRKGGIDDFYFTRNAQETADLIWTVHTWRQKQWGQHKSVNVFNTSQHAKHTMLFKPPFVMEIAGRYTDVGYDTALAIADRYSCAEDFYKAAIAGRVSELAEIVVTTRKDGVDVRLGKKLAQSIVNQTKQRRVIK
jgi:ERCC4-type nuclease